MGTNGDDLSFFKGFLWGGIAGAIAALLFAPKSGKEMREDIRKRSMELRDDAVARLELAQKKAEDILLETKKQLGELKLNAESAVKDLADAAGSQLAEEKTAIVEEKGRIKDAVAAGVKAYKEEKSKDNKTSI